MIRRVRLPAQWRKFLPEPWVLYTVILFIFIAFSLLSWPIAAIDTDLWYHLNAGRYIAGHTIPRESFFSFMAPPRPFVDYYWLFQVMVYALHAASGYQGLIVLRAMAYTATVICIFRLLFKDQRHPGVLPWFLFIGISCCLVLLPRDLLVRPHLFTYGLIVVFLYILELTPQRAWLLPPLGMLWCNVHGITYPVMLLILGAYLVEGAVGQRPAPGISRRHRRTLSLALHDGHRLADPARRPAPARAVYVHRRRCSVH